MLNYANVAFFRNIYRNEMQRDIFQYLRSTDVQARSRALPVWETRFTTTLCAQRIII